MGLQKREKDNDISVSFPVFLNKLWLCMYLFTTAVKIYRFIFVLGVGLKENVDELQFFPLHEEHVFNQN